jgi:hypothetical protein
LRFDPFGLGVTLKSSNSPRNANVTYRWTRASRNFCRLQLSGRFDHRRRPSRGSTRTTPFRDQCSRYDCMWHHKEYATSASLLFSWRIHKRVLNAAAGLPFPGKDESTTPLPIAIRRGNIMLAHSTPPPRRQGGRPSRDSARSCWLRLYVVRPVGAGTHMTRVPMRRR